MSRSGKGPVNTDNKPVCKSDGHERLHSERRASVGPTPASDRRSRAVGDGPGKLMNKSFPKDSTLTKPACDIAVADPASQKRLDKENAPHPNDSLRQKPSSQTQGGLMGNILETVKPTAVISQRNKPEPNASCRSAARPHARQSTRGRCEFSGQRGVRRGLISSCEYVRRRRTAEPNPRSLVDNSVVVADPPNNHTPSSTTGELGRMQEALDISHKLDALITKQRKVETEIRQLQQSLNEMKAEKRALKLRRSALLRGLTYTESEDEHGATPIPSLVSCDVSVASASIPADRLASERLIASVAPVTASTAKPVAFEPWTLTTSLAASHNSPGLSLSSTLDTSFLNSLSNQPSLSSSSDNYHSVSSGQSETRSSITNPTPADSVVSQLYAACTPTSTVTGNTVQSTAHLPSRSVMGSECSSSATTSGGVDLQRLALIRQALQSPDSWRFTFEDVDQMLQRTAARAAASAAAAVAAATDAVSSVPRRITSDSMVNHSCVTSSQTPRTVPVNQPPTPILIKGEPDESTSASFVTASYHFNHNPTGGLPPYQVSSKTNVSRRLVQSSGDATSSEMDSSDEEAVSARKARRPPKLRKLMKADPGQQAPSSTEPEGEHYPTGAEHVSSAMDDTATCSLVTPPQSPTMRERIKYGEFHAFNGGTAAVIVMVLHQSSVTVVLGGQNGQVEQYALKTHECVRTFDCREASVTRMVLDPQEHTVFVGYYDNFFAEYCIQTGRLQYEKFFTNRIEALAVPPCRDIPFLYMGMSNGDILRHHMVDHVTSVLYQCSKATKSGISSMTLVRSGPRILLLIGDQDWSLFVRDACDGSLVHCINSAPHKGPPEGITTLPCGSNFCSYSERALRIHNWKTGVGVLTLQTQKITSCCVMQRYVAIGDSEGSIRVYKLQMNGLPSTRPFKVYYASTRAAITSLICCGVALVSGSLDGTVTVICVTEPANNYTCLYGPFGHNCGIGFASRKDLITHVMDTHLIFGEQKSVMCRWGGGRCRTRFTDTKSIKAISDHLLTHIPD
ncbi:hypothetical protein PHET_07212 [Paragonimus heterotremus]|uniref:Uncharacterized protein n=1 Tax=Paragonimus heterotremus TaxID=100268 RepID=A0A8J4SW24_9TREM|nr:hypothetical protein PHET_07212 [Paragonimus heterotremus]